LPVREDTADLALVSAAAKEAGDIAKSFFGGHYKSWDKSKGNPVTEADIAIDRRLHQILTAARPDYGWLSEETEDDPARLAARRVFVVDPIDGTIGFLKGKAQFATAVAVVADGRSVVGVVYNPMTEEIFSAAAGSGAHLNGEAIRVSERQDIAGCHMLGPRDMFVHPAWDEPWPEMTIETRSSIAYRMALVAAGRFDAMMALSPKNDWDVAAADIIVREAGGRVSAHDGAELHYNGRDPVHPSVVCAGPALHARLLDRVRHLKLKRN